MKLTELLKDIEMGKVYTDKDRPPFKVNEGKSDQSFKKIMDFMHKLSHGQEIFETMSFYTYKK